MSTRCMIAREDTDGKVKAVYCHHDGYPAGVGDTLKKFYQEPSRVEALLNLGDMSSLGIQPEASKDWDAPKYEPVKDGDEYVYCETYAARGEDWEHIKPAEYPNLDDFITDEAGSDRAYLYVYKSAEERWYYMFNSYDATGLRKLRKL